MRLLLIGMMGSGKSTVGRGLAERLGWRHLDSDEQVEKATGKTVPEIFRDRGEAAFRFEEARVLAEAVGSEDPVVVSVAGGAVLDPSNRKLLSTAGRIVWLRADVDTLARRVGRGPGRPLLDGDPAAALARLDVERRPLYAELADRAVDVDARDVDEVVEEIVAWLG